MKQLLLTAFLCSASFVMGQETEDFSFSDYLHDIRHSSVYHWSIQQQFLYRKAKDSSLQVRLMTWYYWEEDYGQKKLEVEYRLQKDGTVTEQILKPEPTAPLPVFRLNSDTLVDISCRSIGKFTPQWSFEATIDSSFYQIVLNTPNTERAYLYHDECGNNYEYWTEIKGRINSYKQVRTNGSSYTMDTYRWYPDTLIHESRLENGEIFPVPIKKEIVLYQTVIRDADALDTLKWKSGLILAKERGHYIIQDCQLPRTFDEEEDLEYVGMMRTTFSGRVKRAVDEYEEWDGRFRWK